MTEELSHLTVDVRPGEKLKISSGQSVSIEMIHKSGQSARLRVTAPRDVKIEKFGSDAKHGNLTN